MTLREGAIVRWVTVVPLLFLRVAKMSLRIDLRRADKIELKKRFSFPRKVFRITILRIKNLRKYS